jgi:hypothetical protein
MVATITLTTAGADTGPFNLYTDVDDYVTPFLTGVSKGALELGYITAAVPNAATIIRVLSNGVCTNYIDIEIDLLPPPDPAVATKIRLIDESEGFPVPVTCDGTIPATEGLTYYNRTTAQLLDQYDVPFLATSNITVVLGYDYMPCTGGTTPTTVNVTILAGQSSTTNTYTASTLVDCGSSNCVLETTDFTGGISNTASLPFV